MRAIVTQAQSPDDIAAVKAVFIDYLAYIEDYLGASLGFQGTEAEFASFPDIYDALFIAKIDDRPVGAVGVKPFETGICELKRLYVRPDGRGHKLGLRLTQAAITAARDHGYNTMYLDTDAGLVHASRIYEDLGFKDIDKYYENPLGCSRYMALSL